MIKKVKMKNREGREKVNISNKEHQENIKIKHERRWRKVKEDETIIKTVEKEDERNRMVKDTEYKESSITTATGANTNVKKYNRSFRH